MAPVDTARDRHTVDWRWVKGHAGHELNEHADFLAGKGLKEAELKHAPRAFSYMCETVIGSNNALNSSNWSLFRPLRLN